MGGVASCAPPIKRPKPKKRGLTTVSSFATMGATDTKKKGEKKMKQVSFRLTDEQFSRLEALEKAYGTNKTRLIVSLLEAEYEALNGNPKMKEALELMQKMNELLKSTGQGKG